MNGLWSTVYVLFFPLYLLVGVRVQRNEAKLRVRFSGLFTFISWINAILALLLAWYLIIVVLDRFAQSNDLRQSIFFLIWQVPFQYVFLAGFLVLTNNIFFNLKSSSSTTQQYYIAKLSSIVVVALLILTLLALIGLIVWMFNLRNAFS